MDEARKIISNLLIMVSQSTFNAKGADLEALGAAVAQAKMFLNQPEEAANDASDSLPE